MVLLLVLAVRWGWFTGFTGWGAIEEWCGVAGGCLNGD